MKDCPVRGRGTQVVRERSAKPLCVGSIPTRASIVLPVSTLPCYVVASSRKTGRHPLRGQIYEVSSCTLGSHQEDGQAQFAIVGRAAALGGVHGGDIDS